MNLNEFKHLIYILSRQFLYTLLASIDLLRKRITEGREYFEEGTWPRPAILDDGWHHKFVQLKNIKLHYVEEGPADGDVLVMVHGFPEFWYSWRFQLNHFKKTHRCLALDMRGYCESEKPEQQSEYHLKHLVDDIRDFIVTLAPGKKVFLAAHDWGAIVCWRVALAYPELLEKLIIFNVPHPIAFQEVFMKSEEQRSKSWYIYFFQSPYLPELTMRLNKMDMLEKMFRGQKAGIRNAKNFTDNDMLAWKHVFSQPGATTGPINYYRQLFDSGTRIKNKNVLVPVMIVWGDADAFLDMRGAFESKKYCTAGVQVEIVEGASHWVQQDEPQKVNKLMQKFMTIHEGNSSKI